MIIQMHCGRCLCTVIACGMLLGAPVTGERQGQQAAQTFRTRALAVPVDVRVLDAAGRPVTDLVREDFTILEDGVPQPIRSFDRRRASVVPDNNRTATGLLLTESPRVFLIVLRRLWLPREVFGTTEAVTAFIRKRLDSRDLVAVGGWGRATDFTTDHEGVARVIERLHAFQDSVDASPDGAERKRRLFGFRGQPIPSDLAEQLDNVFRLPEQHRTRSIPRSATPEVQPLLESVRRGAYSTASGSAVARSAAGGGAAGEVTGLVLDLFAGIQYLRYIAGEKHLVFIAPWGLSLPAVNDDRSLARIASDARVAVSVIQTAGVGTYSGPFGSTPVNMEVRMATRNIAELTGGVASFAEWPARALERIDEATRSGYQLSYSPANQVLDGTQRRITIAVRGPRGATVHHRRSYIAQDDSVPYDHRQFIVQDRILAAAEYAGEWDDLDMSASAEAKLKAVSVEVRLGAAQISIEESEGRYIGRLETATFCTDARERTVGEVWQTIDLKLSRDTYARALEEGVRHSVSVPVSAPAGFCKVVVYDYPSDRVASAIVRPR